MAWLLLVVAAVLGVLVAVLLVLVLRLRAGLASVEARLASSDPSSRSEAPENLPSGSLEERPGYLITRVGESQPEPAARVDTTLFTDQLLKETAVQAAALAHGVRRALAPEARNRIRFQMRQEVRRARKQRRADMRLAYREWTARQRAAMPDDRAESAA